MSEGAPDQALDGPVVAIFRAPTFNLSETFIQDQAASLRRYRPLIVGLERKGPVRRDLAERVLLPSSAAERVAFQLGRVAAMAERMRSFRPSLVHAHFATDGVAAVPLARALGIPLVTTLHGFDVSRRRLSLMLSGRWSWQRYVLFRRALLRRGSLFLAVSSAVRARAVAIGFPEDRTIVHPIGVDLGRFRPGGAAEPGLILHVGRLVEKKGTAVLIAAMARLRSAGVEARLSIVGDGPLRGPLQRHAERMGVAEAVQFHGALPSEEVAAWLARAWLLALPSVTARNGDAEGLPTVLVEAAASGVPAVATDHMGNGEIVLDGRTGFLVAERDPAALAARLAELLASPELRARMGGAARHHAEQGFDIRRQTRALEALYDRLIGLA